MLDLFLVAVIIIFVIVSLKREFYITELEDQNFLYSRRIVELESKLAEVEMKMEAVQEIPLWK